MIPFPTEFEVPFYGVRTGCSGCKAEGGWHEVEMHFFLPNHHLQTFLQWMIWGLNIILPFAVYEAYTVHTSTYQNLSCPNTSVHSAVLTVSTIVYKQ